jgi:hypothetical protein
MEYKNRIDKLTVQLKNNVSSNIAEIGINTLGETIFEEKYDVFYFSCF